MIGEMLNGEYALHGVLLHELIASGDVISAMWFTWTKKRPTDAERVVLEACFIACIDHGAEPPSAAVARTVASCGKPVADAVAAGLLTLGPRHGNAGSAASRLFREHVAAGASAEQTATDALASGQRLPGFGHPVYTADPRTEVLCVIAKKQFPSTPHVDFAIALADALTSKKGKPLPLNVDGAIGAILADMNAPAELADALFLVARSVGLVAHALDEASTSTNYRRG